MSIPIPSDLEPFVDRCVASGTYANHAEVVRAAFALLQERERISQEISAGFNQIDAGDFTEYGPGDAKRFLTSIREQSQRLSSGNRS